MKTELHTMCSYSESMPVVPEAIITREQYMDLFDSKFITQKVLIINGTSGVGISTLMALYAQRHANECASYFVTKWSRAMLNTQVIDESMVKQLKHYVSENTNDVNTLTPLIHKANNESRKKKGNVYFVIDGLDLLPLAYTDSIKRILSQLYGINNAKFLFSGDAERIKQLVPAPDNVTPTIEILPFSKPEIRSYLMSINDKLETEQVETLCMMSRGMADRLHVITEKIGSPEGIKLLLELDANATDDLYAYDMTVIDADELSELFMSLLVFSEYPLSKQVLQKALNISSEEYERIYVQFAAYLAEKDGVIIFRSDVFRKYLLEKLKAKKNQVELILISILEQEDVAKAYDYLPALYNQQHQKETLVRYLTSDKVQHYLEAQKSQAALNKQCDFGFNACVNFEAQMPAYFRFAISRSASREIEKNELADAEIEALMSIGEYEKALALSQNVFLQEEKLKCLLIIAQYQDKLTLSTRNELISQIETLTQIIQFEQIPDKAIELAKLMLPINFVKALTIIDRVAKITKDKSQLDRLYAAISVSYNNEGKQTTDNLSKEDIAESRIVDSELRQMATVMKTIMRESSVEYVIREMTKLPTVTSQLYFLHFWIPDHKNTEKIEKAINYALKLVIEASNTTIPKVSFIRRFCEPLPLVPKESIISIVAMIDAVISSIKYPTIEYVELQLLIIAALKKVSDVKAGNRAFELYYEIDALTDMSIQAHCKALLLRDFDKIGASDMEKWIMPSFALQKDLTDSISDLLSRSAYHIKIVEGPIKALVCSYPTFVHEIISKMNTEERRCRAYLIAATEYASQIEPDKIDCGYYESLLSKITYDLSDLGKPMLIMARKIVEEKDVNKCQQNIEKLCAKLPIIEHPSIQCEILANFIVWMTLNNANNRYTNDTLEPMLHDVWSHIEVPWEKVELGYRIAQILAKANLSVLAKQYVEETADTRQKMLLSSYSCIEAYESSLTLLVHSIGLLIRTGVCEENDIDELNTLFAYNGNLSEAMIAWACVALEYREAGKLEEFSKIVCTKLSIPYNDSSLYNRKRVIYHISPALYLCGHSIFYDRIKEYDDCFKNLCIENIARYIETHYPYAEYTDNSSIESQRVLSYEDYESLINLMQNTTDECFIYNYIAKISDAIKINRENKLSREQIKILSDRMIELVNNCLPATYGIQHKGYKIICLAMIDSCAPDRQLNVVKLRDDIEKINNIADKAFLYSNTAGLLKKKDQSANFIDSAMQEAEQIGDMFDKLNRFNSCLLQAIDNNTSKVRPIAKKIMESMISNKNGTYQDFQRYVDTISEYDDKLAEDMLEMIDTDPSRVQYKKRLKNRLSSNKRLENAKTDYDQILKLSKAEKIRFFDKQIENLIKKKYIKRDICKTESIVKAIYEEPITDMQNAALFFMENLYEENRHNYVSSDTLKEIYHLLLQNIKLVLALAAGTKDKLDKINRLIGYGEKMRNENLIKVGQWKEGQKKILSWYNDHPYGTLRIIDPYFTPSELRMIKSLMDINNDLNVTILTCLNGKYVLEDYQKEWKKISSELSGRIQIKSFCFEDQPTKCPIHDRWWVIYDNENDVYLGKRLASLSTLGSRETEISDMDENALKDVKKVWERYVINEILRVAERRISYGSITIK